MRKSLMFIVLAAFVQAASAQYQIANSNFESWTATSGEPVHWHGFKSAKGTWAGQAKGTLVKSEDTRPGSTGSYSAVITSGSVFGIINNGSVTTGQLNAGSMSAANTANHAEMDKTSTATDKNGDKFYMPLTGYPDAIKFWLKFSQAKATSSFPYASFNAVITDGSYYQDPEDKTYTNKVAQALNNTITTCDWTEFTISFDYDSYISNDKQPAAILCTFGTNATPGKGSDGDKVFIDDMELIYFSELSSAQYNGEDVAFTDGAATIDALYDPSLLSLTKKGKGGTIETSIDGKGLLTITVKGDNISEDATNYHTYSIQFYAQATMTVNAEAQYGTFCAPYAVEVPAGVQAYTVSSVENDVLNLTEVVGTSIPANTPVILYAEGGLEAVGSFGIPEAGTPEAGLLTGVYEATAAPVGSYVLQTIDDRLGFYQVAEGQQPTVGANRCYLTAPSSEAKAFFLDADGATGIKAFSDSPLKGEDIYNLAGQRMSKMQSGINIANGKKILR